MIARHTDARLLNEIANDPAVRPWVGNTELGVLDLSPIAADERNYVLLGEHGGFVCLFLMEGIYECHALFKRGTRPEVAQMVAREGAAWMFIRTPCIEILTRIPDGHIATKSLAARIGFRAIFSGGWEAFAGKSRPVDVYRLGLDDWLAATCENDGTGYVGAARAMLEAGRQEKALAWYDRWALLARQPIARTIAELQERLEQAPRE